VARDESGHIRSWSVDPPTELGGAPATGRGRVGEGLLEVGEGGGAHADERAESGCPDAWLWIGSGGSCGWFVARVAGCGCNSPPARDREGTGVVQG
jgi:hypothetical protein